MSNHPAGSKPMKREECYLIARFTTKDNDDDVFFVKMRTTPRGQSFTCSCDTFAVNLVNEQMGSCKHVVFCKKSVVDVDGSIPIDNFPKAKVRNDEKTLKLWMDRSVNTYLID